MTKHKGIPIEEWITAVQAAERLGITARHVKRLVQSGELKGRMIANALWLVNPDSLLNWTPKRKRKDKPIE